MEYEMLLGKGTMYCAIVLPTFELGLIMCPLLALFNHRPLDTPLESMHGSASACH